jgi:biotin-(acetyl-CoA carboxylase) ligase
MLKQPRDELLERLSASIELWRAAGPSAVIDRWRQRSDTLGRRVRLTLPGRSIEGIAEDITARGELIIDGETYIAGSLTHLETHSQ